MIRFLRTLAPNNDDAGVFHADNHDYPILVYESAKPAYSRLGE